MDLSYNLEPRKAICYVQEPDPRVQETVFSSNMGIRKQLWQGKIFEFFFKYTKLFYNVKHTPNIQGWSLPPWAPASWLLCRLRGQSGPRWACVGMSVGSSRSKSKREAQVLKPELELESSDGQSIFTKPPSFGCLCAGSGPLQEKSDSIRQWCSIGLTLAANSPLVRVAPGRRVLSIVPRLSPAQQQSLRAQHRRGSTKTKLSLSIIYFCFQRISEALRKGCEVSKGEKFETQTALWAKSCWFCDPGDGVLWASASTFVKGNHSPLHLAF